MSSMLHPTVKTIKGIVSGSMGQEQEPWNRDTQEGMRAHTLPPRKNFRVEEEGG